MKPCPICNRKNDKKRRKCYACQTNFPVNKSDIIVIIIAVIFFAALIASSIVVPDEYLHQLFPFRFR